MESAAIKFELELARLHFRDPSPPVITNVYAEPNGEAALIPELLRDQITSPVRFTAILILL